MWRWMSPMLLIEVSKKPRTSTASPCMASLARWTWMSASPGSTTRCVRSILSVVEPANASISRLSPTARTCPS
jgi:hypothetical protein